MVSNIKKFLKNKNMKQILSLALALLPCLALAQYPSNGNQKITLGEQTTADGLIWRGVAADTTLTAKSDTAAYFVLDTVNKKLYFFKASAIPKWNEISGSGGGGGVTTFSAGLTGLTPSTATSGAVTLGGTLAVANGGTGSATISPNNYLIRTNSSGIFDTSAIYEANGNVGIGTSQSSVKFTVNNNTDLPPSGPVAGSTVWFLGANSVSNQILYDGFSGTNSFTGRRSGGTSLIPTSTPNNSSLLLFIGRGYGTTGYSASSRVSMQFVTDEDFTDTNQGTRISFLTTTNGTLSQLERMRISNNGNIGIGQTTPTAVLHLKAGTATASTAPLKFTSGTNLTTAEAGAVEFDGTNLLFTPSATRHTVNHGLTGSATLNFPSTTTLLSADLTITVTGAADGDVVSLGVPNTAVNANTSYSAWVSAANTVTVRFNNYSSGTVDPASALFKVFVTK